MIWTIRVHLIDILSHSALHGLQKIRYIRRLSNVFLLHLQVNRCAEMVVIEMSNGSFIHWNDAHHTMVQNLLEWALLPNCLTPFAGTLLADITDRFRSESAFGERRGNSPHRANMIDYQHP
jgi:hypothetical protein